MLSNISSVLFDLDGTLIDTAPDLSYALNLLREEHGMPPIDYEKFRNVVSLGGTAMIRMGFNINSTDPQFHDIRSQFLDLYSQNIYRSSRLFDGMDQVLHILDSQKINWGIVTNKPGWLTSPLLKKMQLDSRAICVISGDTLPYAKPHPEPLLHACKIMNCSPVNALYVGDAKRDIEAGVNAGMSTMIAAYGYIEEHAQLDEWGANAIVDSPLQILDRINIGSV
jgi:phosphoglycolate phosphatase